HSFFSLFLSLSFQRFLNVVIVLEELLLPKYIHTYIHTYIHKSHTYIHTPSLSSLTHSLSLPLSLSLRNYTNDLSIRELLILLGYSDLILSVICMYVHTYIHTYIHIHTWLGIHKMHD